ncbi:MAG: hypothetical protein ABIO70_06580 [Pseudomonadota bacterium]
MLARLLLALVFLGLTPGLVVVCAPLGAALLDEPRRLALLLGGLVLGLGFHRALLRRMSGYLTLQHECKHAIMALFFLRRIEGFVVTWRRGGEVRFRGGLGGALGDHAIGLAPYFLLLTALPAALVLPLAPAEWGLAPPLVLGFLVALDLANIVHDLRCNFHREVFQAVDGSIVRSDVGRRGYALTVASILFYGGAQLILVLQLLVHGYAGLPDLARALGAAWWDTGVWIRGWLG